MVLKRLSIFLICSCLLGFSVIVSAIALAEEANTPIDYNQQLSKLDFKKVDSDLIAYDIKTAKPIDPKDIIDIKKFGLDYSPYLTLTQNQDSWGGCIGRSMIHTLDMLNEMEHPYTPDLSFWYLDIRQTQLANGGAVNTKNLLENYGVCPETTLPTDYDKTKIVNGHLDYNAMQMPTAQANYEASFYKVKLLSDPIVPTVNAIKSLLIKYGPILAEGPMVEVQGPNPACGHCVTIGGYNEAAKTFKCLNSWGDHWRGTGFFALGYDKLPGNVQSVRYILDGPSDRTGTQFAYTARIRVEGNGVTRNKLTVGIGLEGKNPKIIWDTPNEINCVDWSQDLCIDFSLPSYASTDFPPQSKKRWYIEVINNGASGTFQVKEITLAKLYKKNGLFQTSSYKFIPEDANAVVGAKQAKKIFVPIKPIIILDDITLDKPLQLHH